MTAVEEQRLLHGSSWKSIAGEGIGRRWQLVRSAAPTQTYFLSLKAGRMGNGKRCVMSLQNDCYLWRGKCGVSGGFGERCTLGWPLRSDGMTCMEGRSISTFLTRGISWIPGKRGLRSSIATIYTAGGFPVAGILTYERCLGSVARFRQSSRFMIPGS